MSYQATKTQRNLKCIFISGTIQPKKATYCIFPFILHSGKGQTVEMANR